MKSTIAVAVGLALSGCAISHDTYAPDGRRAYSINCSGMAMTWGACYEKAGELCRGSGYDVLAGGSESGVVMGGGPSSFFGGSTISRSMLVSCKAPAS